MVKLFWGAVHRVVDLVVDARHHLQEQDTSRWSSAATEPAVRWLGTRSGTLPRRALWAWACGLRGLLGWGAGVE